MIQEYLSFSDLQGLDSSPSSVREAFKERFNNVTPDGIALNHETYYDAVKPPITEQYGHFCYKDLGIVDYSRGEEEPAQQAIIGSNTAYNRGDTEAEISLQVTGSWAETTGWNSSITTGLSFSQSFGLEGVFETGMEFSVDVTAGVSGEESISKSSTATVTVKVPPHSRVKVEMVATMKKEKLHFSAPIAVKGSFGANFPDRVDGHYFWFLDARTVLNKISGEINGVIEGTAAFDVHTDIGQAEPIG
ncbi:hypothetical protein [Shewanella surugensis]|uniref:Aerolysin family beta-barrel pore-forming toxin n=1 Tax=Shewanella surugensis TaxID=212020 RepID=A0ABT0LEU6_9GAMM|nr:hypothetical protein [Shewanella surugensis]MCL1126185.1 hypothetical protein [Shewanella surugensis]